MSSYSSRPSVAAMDSREFKLFRGLIEQQTGISLREGKQVMLGSRLSKRLQHHNLQTFSDYYRLLEKEGGTSREMVEFINCVTTNKTSFYRESHHFDFLRDTLVPEMQRAARQGAPRKIRVWSAACSTGEEPYSIAICLLDALHSAPEVRCRPDPGVNRAAVQSSAAPAAKWSIEVFASDVDTEVLDVAAQAIYNESALGTVDDELQKKHFLRGKGNMAGQVRVKPETAACVRFQRINLMSHSWPVTGLFDAIFFRNALIYFNQDTQNTFLRKMLRFLRPAGYLMLGHSEHVPWLHDAVTPLNKTIYQLKELR